MYFCNFQADEDLEDADSRWDADSDTNGEERYFTFSILFILTEIYLFFNLYPVILLIMKRVISYSKPNPSRVRREHVEPEGKGTVCISLYFVSETMFRCNHLFF